jgi:hypothetical protein
MPAAPSMVAGINAAVLDRLEKSSCNAGIPKRGHSSNTAVAHRF